MNQLPLNCQQLQRFLERQWQKIRGIVSEEAFALREGRAVRARQVRTSPQARPLLDHDSSNNVEQASSLPRTRSPLWKGSMDLIVEEYSVTDIVSVINTTCESLTSLLDAGHGYRKYYVLLLEALVKLLTALKDVEMRQPDLLRSSGIFSQLRVSVSVTYALVEKVSARQQLLIFCIKFRKLTCTAGDSVPDKLRDQLTETKRLLKEVVRSIEIYDQAYHPVQDTAAFRGEASQAVPIFGVNKLTVAADHHRSLLLSGAKVAFFIRDSDINVVYTVQIWLNNPNSLFRSAKRLSASVECPSGQVFNIGVPGYPNKEVDVQSRTALIVAGFEQAQVRSLLPMEERSRFPCSRKKGEALLQESQASSGSPEVVKSLQRRAGELLVHSMPKYQKYRGEIIMSNMVLKLEYMGQTYEVRKLILEGKKQMTKVWYKCCVEMTGEVLAIYRQKRRGRSVGRRHEGVFHMLGIGNHPDLRTLIVSSFVAMGLNSFL